nr:MAG TPA: hypothetical protein [Caudoviricetes sp.]
MKGYKGFDKNWKCRDMQYEVGKTYEEAEARLCNKGLHFCENPFDVFSYYSPENQSRYAVVEAENVTDEKDSDTKRVAKKLTIKTELNLIGIVKAGMEYIKEHINVEKIKEKAFDESTAATSGYRSTAATSGNESTAIVEGEDSVAIALGARSKAKGALGCWLILAEWEENDDGMYRKDVKCFKVDGEIIKADMFYMLEDGEAVLVDSGDENE